MNIIQKLLCKMFGVTGDRTSMIIAEQCPKCGSMDTERCHHNGTFAVPECFYNSCNECDHQWGHG